MRKSYFFWAPIALGVFVLGVVFAAGLVKWFVSTPALIVVLLPPLAISLGSYNFREIGRCFTSGFSGKVDRAELTKALVFFRVLGRNVLVSGFAGLVIGLMVVAASLEEASALGLGVSLSMLTLLYSVVIHVIVVNPFRMGLEKRLAESEAVIPG